jgi:predicted  nucleic acid-binding Zn-ribbon protein
MGRLKDFHGYLEERRALLSEIEQRLCKLQEKYESYFSEIAKVRDSEFKQLRENILTDRSKLPDDFNRALDNALKVQQRQFSTKLDEMKRERNQLQEKAEKQRQASMKAEKSVRKKNVRLDREEEELKARNEKLLAQIAEFNRRIKELGKGFGFFSGLFKMRALHKERKLLDQEQADIAARIDKLRKKWQTTDHRHHDQEGLRKREWVDLSTEAAAVQTKIEYLESSKTRIVQRSAMEQVLFDMRPTLSEPKQGDPPCPRCKMPNPQTHRFCHICAIRLTEDRPDFSGSISEIAEINIHHARFSEGMQTCQEIIGLVRGLKTGLDAFMKSVDDVLDSERRYPLPKLKIDVPKKSLDYGRHFDGLKQTLGMDLSLHPKAFAKKIQIMTSEIFTENRIKDYFETMGEELSRQADSQW